LEQAFKNRLDGGEIVTKISSIETLTRQILDPSKPGYDVTALSDSIEAVFREYGTEDIATLIEQLVRQNKLSVDEGSNILRVAVWSGSENGSSLLRTLDNWLREGNDPTKVALAINQDVYPFHDPVEMRRVLTRICETYPEHAARCRSLMESRPHGQNEKRGT
jgi:hypothetical protein